MVICNGTENNSSHGGWIALITALAASFDTNLNVHSSSIPATSSRKFNPNVHPSDIWNQFQICIENHNKNDDNNNYVYSFDKDYATIDLLKINRDENTYNIIGYIRKLPDKVFSHMEDSNLIFIFSIWFSKRLGVYRGRGGRWARITSCRFVYLQYERSCVIVWHFLFI